MLKVLARRGFCMRSFASLTIACCWLLHVAGARAAPTEPDQEQQLRAEASRARTWRYAWSGVNAGLTLGAFVALPLDRRESRPDWIVSGAGSGLTLLTTFFLPLRVESAVAELDALPLGQRAARLPRLYRESATDERERVSWPWHVANVGLSALAGGIIAFGYDHYVSGAITAAGRSAIVHAADAARRRRFRRAATGAAFGVHAARRDGAAGVDAFAGRRSLAPGFRRWAACSSNRQRVSGRSATIRNRRSRRLPSLHV
jgi:hypothetical protein